jgi:hypothetical protein
MTDQLLEERSIYITLAKNSTLEEDFDVVEFWQKINSTRKLLELSSIAMSVVLVPVSSVGMKRRFSKTGQILSP